MLSAEEYIVSHWQPRSVWTHLSRRKHRRRLRACAVRMEGETFADVGCAFGHSTQIMSQHHPGDWTGIDFSKTAIGEAVKEFGNTHRFAYCAGVDELLEHPCSYDGVVCSEVMEHVEDDEALVAGLSWITNKVLVVTTPCVEVGDPGHLRLYTEEMLRDLFGPQAEILSSGPFWYVTWRPWWR